MTSRIIFIVGSLCKTFCIYASHYYHTPAFDDQFDNFEITRWTPVDGTLLGGDDQTPLGIYSRRFLTFNFMGKGNALLYFQENRGVENTSSFTVEIGGGSDFDRVAIYDLKPYNKEPLVLKSIIGITSAKESRTYWIHWNIVNETVSVGVCTKPGEHFVLQYSPLVSYNISHVYISTSNKSSGAWQFPSDNDLFGGCDSSPQSCTVGDCDDDDDSKTRSTCIVNDGGETSFGNAICPGLCYANVICTRANDCLAESCPPETTPAGSVTTDTSTIIQAIPNVVPPSTSTASNTDLKSPTTSTMNPTVKSSLSEHTKSISSTLTAICTTSSTRKFNDTVTDLLTTYLSTYLVTAHNTKRLNKPYFFADKGKVAAVFAAGSVVIVGAMGIIICAKISTRKSTTILPTAVSAGDDDDKDKENEETVAAQLASV